MLKKLEDLISNEIDWYYRYEKLEK